MVSFSIKNSWNFNLIKIWQFSNHLNGTGHKSIPSVKKSVMTTRIYKVLFIFCVTDQNILKENEDISLAKSDLLAAKIVLQNRLEYDQIAKEILAFQSRPELLK